jgi:hypothetical protein
LIIYIAHWNYNNPKNIIIEEINADYDENKCKCHWDQLLTPEIFPVYNMLCCGHEERAYFNNKIHYFVSGSLEQLKLYINDMINRRKEYYKKKLEMIENINIVIK